MFGAAVNILATVSGLYLLYLAIRDAYGRVRARRAMPTHTPMPIWSFATRFRLFFGVLAVAAAVGHVVSPPRGVADLLLELPVLVGVVWIYKTPESAE